MESESAPSTLSMHAPLLELFDGDLRAVSEVSTNQANQHALPTRAKSSQLLDSLFSQCSIVSQFLQESELRQLICDACDSITLQLETLSQRDLGLVHSVLALAYLYDVPLHRTEGCRATVVKA